MIFYMKEKIEFPDKKMNLPEKVYESVKDIAFADQEMILVLPMTAKNVIIRRDLVAMGGIDSARVDFRILIRRVLMAGAPSFIVAHNHPSGEIEPSNEDFDLTKKLKKIADMLDLKFLDHLIIGDGKYYSFTEKMVMP